MLLGQSNMSGRGEIGEVEPIENPTVFMFRNDKWTPAKEPLHTDGNAGIGLAMSFADELLKQNPSMKIGFVPCAVGGSPLSDWVKGGDLYEEAVRQAKRATEKGTIEAILWHQGETDSMAKENASTYFQRFTDTMNSLRQELQIPQAAIVAGRLIELAPPYELYYLINEALEKASKILDNFAVVSADGLTAYEDNVHLTAVALREFGKRYADNYMTLGDTND